MDGEVFKRKRERKEKKGNKKAPIPSLIALLPIEARRGNSVFVV